MQSIYYVYFLTKAVYTFFILIPKPTLCGFWISKRQKYPIVNRDAPICLYFLRCDSDRYLLSALFNVSEANSTRYNNNLISLIIWACDLWSTISGAKSKNCDRDESLVDRENVVYGSGILWLTCTSYCRFSSSLRSQTSKIEYYESGVLR